MRLVLTYRIYLFITVLIWALYGIFTVYCLFNIIKKELFISVLLSGIIMQLSVHTFMRNWYKYGRPNLLDWFRLTTFIVLILNFFNLLDYLDTHETILVDNHVYVDTSFAWDTILMIFVGLLAMAIGEALAVRSFRVVKNIQPKHYQFRNFNLFIFIAVAITLLQIYLMISGLLGYGTDLDNLDQNAGFLLQTIQIVGPLILVLLSTFVFVYKYRHRFIKSVLVYYFVLQLLYGFLSGMKEAMIIPVILVLIPYILSGGKIPKYFIATAVIFTILLYPVNNTYRDISNNSYGKVNKSQAFIAAVNITIEKDFSELFFSGAEQYGSRLSLFPMNMYSVHIESSWQTFKNLDRYIYLPIAWIIPRAILPDKPQSNTGAILYEMQTGSDSTSITPSTYGWAYMEGGLIPLTLTFFLFGFTVSAIELRLHLNRLFDLIIFSLILITLIKVETDIYFRLAGILQTLLVTYIIYKLLIKETRLKSL